MFWSTFEKEAPELAAWGRAVFDRKMALLGTLRKDGAPRIEPIEPYIGEGRLLLAMLWQSRKALNLLRDPRCTLHNPVTDPNGSDVEFKLYGRAIHTQDANLRARYLQTFQERWQSHPFHLFILDIESAAEIELDIGKGKTCVMAWKPETGNRKFQRSYP